jgi:hypothetical protein
MFHHKAKRFFSKKSELSKALIILGAIFVLLFIVSLLVKNFSSDKNKKPNSGYEALIQVRDQVSRDPVEDARASLKAGDVIAVFPAGHSWSSTERMSYLILRLDISEEQSRKLTESVTKKHEFPKEEKQAQEERIKKIEAENIKNGKEKGQGLMGMDRERMDTIRARAYRIKMNKFKGFDPNELLNGQPYMEKMYGWNIVEKK